ncbi:CRISPR-associated endonuclease Cas3'', partial [Eubacterium aggregans]|uniref:CRISPR-associated endonuclease Cas3'' n=1 Tax=Eubacterium aggregans TaxID=81409 RepID=UPI003F3986E8
MLAHISKDQREETVTKHCVAVAQFARTLGKDVGLEHTAFLTALIYDWGKSRGAFSEYIKKASADPSSVRRGSVDHSTAGAKYIFETYYGEEPLEQLTAQLIATAICS